MKLSFKCTSYVFCVLVVVFSCTRTPAVPPSIPPTTAGLNINLSYPDNSGQIQKTIELIFSETGGLILLDTIGPINTNIVFTLKTSQSLVDLTTVVDSVNGQYAVTTFKAVNPSTWSTAKTYSYFISYPIPAPSGNASIYYSNMPKQGAVYQFSDAPNGNGILQYYTDSFAEQPYTRYGSNYVYLFFPNLGLYNFHLPSSNADTVDLSHIDTGVKVDYSRPGYKFTAGNLTGIMDTTDLSKSILLYEPIVGVNQDTSDVEHFAYPTKYVQDYELFLAAISNKNDQVYYYAYGDTVPTSMPFPDETSYALLSSENNNFSINFLTVHPTSYATQWIDGNVSWKLYSSSDSMILHPLDLLKSLKSKKLAGQDFSSLTISTFFFETDQGYNYQTFFSYICNPELAKTKRLASASGFGHIF